MPTIAEAVENDDNYSTVKGRKKLSDREAALLNAAYVVAESELAKVKVRYEKKVGDHRVQKEKTKTAVLATLASSKIKGIAEFLVTPYIDHAPRELTSDSKNKSGEIIEGEIIKERVNEIDDDEKNENSQISKEREAVEAAPAWSKSIIFFIEHLFAKLSPLTTAIWFLLLVAAAGAAGWAQKTYLESNYDHLNKTNERLEKELESLTDQKIKIESLEAEKLTNEKLISGLNAEIETLKTSASDLEVEIGKQATDFQNQLVDLQNKQAQTIVSFQENLDIASKNQIEALTESNKRLELEAINLKVEIDQQKQLISALESTAKADLISIEKQSSTIEDLNGTVSLLNEQLTSANQASGQLSAVVAFTNSTIALVDEVLYKPRVTRSLVIERREDFTSGFEKLRKTSKNTLDLLGIRSSM
jgi:hypothetical protein